jgi:mycothiol synthase
MNALTQNETIVELPRGFTVRGATLDDLASVHILINRWSQAVIGRDDLTDLDALRHDLQQPGFNMQDDIRLIFAPNGQLAGYLEVWTNAKPPVHPWIWGRVDPDYEGKGLGTWMIRWAEQRALQVLPNVPAELRFAPRTGTYRQALKAKKFYEDLGYRHVRSFYNMLIEMDKPVLTPEFPAGITLRTYNKGTDAETVFRAQTDSFRDHYGFVEQPFEEGLKRWKHFWEEDESADPTLLFIAMDGDQIAGINLCRPQAFDDPDMGWVNVLGVRRPWRKRGLGLALLRHSFNEFYRRGKRKVGLGVDAENLTGALRLYENAGMHVHQTFDQYEKELRPGIEISTQTLSQE